MSPDIQQLTQLSFEALRAGNGSKARSGFEQVIALGKADTMHWLGLAMACARLGDELAALTALDRSLQLEPRNLRAVLLKADLLTRQGHTRPAFECYRHVLQLAGSAPGIPEDLRPGIDRARQMCAEQDRKYRGFILDRLRAQGIHPTDCHPRFRESLELAFGDKEIFYQQPRMFYYPGLPQIQFYERDQFDWVAPVEAATGRIRAELLRMMREPDRFAPYVRSGDSTIGRDDQGLADNSDWSALYLWEHSRLVAENLPLFPDTLAALDLAPMPHIAKQAPMALFSKLAPGTRIPPHTGLLNIRLICHLPLVVPAHCGALRVGNETRPWVEGQMLIFDDSIEHEAWNVSDQERVVLLFEIWRPEIGMEEREMLTAMLVAVKEYADQ